MRQTTRLAALSTLFPLLIACGNGASDRQAGSTPPTENGGGATSPLEAPETVVEGLEVPWALAFVDARTILVTERPGRVRVVRDGRLEPEPALELPVVAEGEGGLLGIALHPDFAAQRWAYLYYTAGEANRVSRFPVSDDLRFGAEEVLVDGIPAARFHDGGRLHFGRDGLLYVTTGDAGQPETAADPSSLAGKILRLRPDGHPAPGNPFEESPVFSYGHRNPQGFDWDTGGRLYASEHGPTGEFGLCCHDELNRIEAGAFYGWPFRAGRVEAAGSDPPADPRPPVAASGEDTWAPAGVALHQPDEGHADLLVATLEAERLLHFLVDPADPDAVEYAGVALDGLGRLRAAVIGPDGCLYLTTSNTDGRGDPRPGDDRIVRTCFTNPG